MNAFEKIDRKQVIIEKNEVLNDRNKEYWKNATIKEKLQTITYLRECFYGKEATTGRLQRFHIEIINKAYGMVTQRRQAPDLH